MNSKKNSKKLLQVILVLAGGFLIVAFGAVFLPVDWMAAAHEWLGLGEFPRQPITDYLARSASLLYGVHGVLMLYTGLTIDSHHRMVKLFGWLHLVIGLTVLGIDLHAAMPGYWTLIEGPPVALLGVLMLYLNSRAFGSEPQLK